MEASRNRYQRKKKNASSRFLCLKKCNCWSKKRGTSQIERLQVSYSWGRILIRTLITGSSASVSEFRDQGIDTAVNGAVAVEKIAASNPGDYDLILMDIQMPIMDGYQATRRIRQMETPGLSSIPIIAMTANAFDEDRKAAMDCGMNDFISKPLDLKELIQVLNTTLGGTLR